MSVSSKRLNGCAHISATTARYRHLGLFAVAGLLALIALGGPAPAAAADPPGSWAFAIGPGALKGTNAQVADRLGRFDLVVVDGEEVTRGQVAAVKARGTTVLAYLSVGTIEKWRSWYPRLRQFRLKAWDDWEGEWFADTSRPGFRSRITRIARKRILRKGVDGLFLDNVDMVEQGRHARQRKGMEKLVRKLDRTVGGRQLWAQNGARGVLRGYPKQNVKPLVRYLDGWNREDFTHTWDFDRKRYRPAPGFSKRLQEVLKVKEEGITVTVTDYMQVEPLDTEAACRSYSVAATHGLLPFVADIRLRARSLAANPPACP